MKKTLFSLAFVAASGAYVATANHVFTAPNENAVASAVDTATPVEPSQPTASTEPLVASSEPLAALDAAPVIARASPVALPLLPRPRPAPPAAVVVQPAASTSAATGSAAGYRDGTYTGSDENAYYGRVQVQVTVTNHQIASIKVLDYPQDRRTSRYINSQALPMLKQEVIAADSGSIDTVSGATLTSEAYIRSLDTALAQAGGNNA